MIYVGIDVAKDKHDCFITNSDGEVLFNAFTIPNNADGFHNLYQKISSLTNDFSNVKAGLEATGHYNYNLLGFLMDKGLPTFVINPLHTNLFRKSLSLRQTKTDKVDAHTIALMMMSGVNLQSYSDTSYHNEELKSLTRYRFDKVKERAKLKTSVSRLVNILFPELEKLVPTLHMVSVYALLSELPSCSQIASCHLTHLTKLLERASKGRYSKEKAIEIRNAAKQSIGSNMPAKSLELKHTIKLIQELSSEINEIEDSIKSIMDSIHSPITSIPGINYRMGAIITAEIGDLTASAHLIKSLLMRGFRLRPINQGSLTAVIPTWKSVALGICTMRCLMLQILSAYGTIPLPLTLLRNVQKGSITMLPYPMPPRNWYGLFIGWKNHSSFIIKQHKICPCISFLSTGNDALFVMQFSKC